MFAPFCAARPLVRHLPCTPMIGAPRCANIDLHFPVATGDVRARVLLVRRGCGSRPDAFGIVALAAPVIRRRALHRPRSRQPARLRNQPRARRPAQASNATAGCAEAHDRDALPPVASTAGATENEPRKPAISANSVIPGQVSAGRTARTLSGRRDYERARDRFDRRVARDLFDALVLDAERLRPRFERRRGAEPCRQRGALRTGRWRLPAFGLVTRRPERPERSVPRFAFTPSHAPPCQLRFAPIPAARFWVVPLSSPSA
jgi:hypothetical protein